MANMSLSSMFNSLFEDAQVHPTDDQQTAFLTLPTSYQASEENRELRNLLFRVLHHRVSELKAQLNGLTQLEAVQAGDPDAKRQFVNENTGEILHPWIRIKLRRLRRNE